MIFRVEKTKDYTVMSNYHLKNKNMSFQAKGLLSVMLSLPEDWDYSINGLVSMCKESKTSIQNTLKELENHKHLKRIRTQNKIGRFEYIYDIYEKPYDEEPYMEKPNTEEPCTVNVPQLNTKELNTNKLNTKELKEINNNKLLFIKKKFIKPTIDEVRDYCYERGNNINAEQFIDYYESNGWKIGRNSMKDWKATIRTWERNNLNNNNKNKPKTLDELYETI